MAKQTHRFDQPYLQPKDFDVNKFIASLAESVDKFRKEADKDHERRDVAVAFSLASNLVACLHNALVKATS